MLWKGADVSERLAAACVRSLVSHAARDEGVWVLDGDLADSYGALEFAKAWPSRFLMAGIAEQNMVGVAAGMASCKLRPWVFSFAAFLAYRAADQIRTSVSQTFLPVTLVGSHAGGCGGRNGKTHQCVGDLAVMGGMPGIDVWTPCDRGDVEFATESILSRKSPAYLRTPRELCPSLPGKPAVLRWLTEESDMLLLANGLSAHWALEVHSLLALRGIRLGVLHAGRFTPLPPSLGEIVRKARHWFAIEDHIQHGGLADAVARASGRLPRMWFGWPPDWSGGSGHAAALRRQCRLDAESICSSIVECVENRRAS
jgi:transketolase